MESEIIYVTPIKTSMIAEIRFDHLIISIVDGIFSLQLNLYGNIYYRISFYQGLGSPISPALLLALYLDS